ncbi:hypothetical protein [Devosia sp. SL43]|uniref:hypothetical protein n=1 Tax=Devosia sp. SL43 TaxID=2806348 RepID=UPI001F436EFB|nr:hypothetical protein [Devosia sp. SL43]UJW87906.1 hypothetical protein IM737_20710 [Devosia sp. SL43]
MTSITDRILSLQIAERDYQRGLIHAHGEQRLVISQKLARIRRQIAMLTESDRQPMARPEQARRFK